LLLDEITVDLDVLGRAELMRFLKDECKQRGATVIYATHIFDGLEFWPSHVAYVARGQVIKVVRVVVHTRRSIPHARVDLNVCVSECFGLPKTKKTPSQIKMLKEASEVPELSEVCTAAL